MDINNIRWIYTPHHAARVRVEPEGAKVEFLTLDWGKWRAWPHEGHPLMLKEFVDGEGAYKAVLFALAERPAGRALVVWTRWYTSKSVGVGILLGPWNVKWEIEDGWGAMPTWARAYGNRAEPEDLIPPTAWARLLGDEC